MHKSYLYMYFSSWKYDSITLSLHFVYTMKCKTILTSNKIMLCTFHHWTNSCHPESLMLIIMFQCSNFSRKMRSTQSQILQAIIVDMRFWLFAVVSYWIFFLELSASLIFPRDPASYTRSLSPWTISCGTYQVPRDVFFVHFWSR